LRANQLACRDGFVASARTPRMPSLRVGAASAGDVVVRGGRERSVAPGELRPVQTAGRLLLSRFAERRTVGEKARQANGRRSRAEIRGDGRKSAQRQADQGDDLRRNYGG